MISAVLASLSAAAADYHWTGAAGDHLWSTPGNWETQTGGAVASVATSIQKSYNFGTRNSSNVGWENGLVVTQDVDVVIGSAMAFNPADNNPITLEIVSASGKKMSMPVSNTIYCQKNCQVTLSVDMSGDSSTTAIKKTNDGTLIWNLKAANKSARELEVQGGTVALGESGVSPNLRVKLNTTSGQSTAKFENGLDGGELHGLYSGSMGGGISSLGSVCLNGNDLSIGGESASSSTNFMPFAFFGEEGTLALKNERRAQLRGLPVGGTLAVDRADAHIVAPNTAIRWTFDETGDPTNDPVGSGHRMLAPNGLPEVAEDAERGNVLSISGGKYFKGPDTNAGLDGLLLQSTNNPYTVAFWFKPAAGCDSKGKIFYWGEATANKSAGLRLNDAEANGLMFTIWGTNKNIPTSASPRDGNWHHFAAVYDGRGDFTLYYDGESALSFTASTYNPPNKNFYIGSVYGGWVTDGSNPYTGSIDDFLIGSYALSASEIAALKNDGLAATISAPSVEARSAGEVAFAKSEVSAQTLSGNALAGGVTMLADGSTLTVGAEAGDAETEFKGKISGGDTTLVKEGENYTLILSGDAAAVTNIVVKEGQLGLKRSSVCSDPTLSTYCVIALL